MGKSSSRKRRCNAHRKHIYKSRDCLIFHSNGGFEELRRKIIKRANIYHLDDQRVSATGTFRQIDMNNKALFTFINVDGHLVDHAWISIPDPDFHLLAQYRNKRLSFTAEVFKYTTGNMTSMGLRNLILTK